jgi:hypothetical protein
LEKTWKLEDEHVPKAKNDTQVKEDKLGLGEDELRAAKERFDALREEMDQLSEEDLTEMLNAAYRAGGEL